MITRRHAAGACSVVLVLSVLAIMPSSRPAAATDAKTGKLSPRLETLAATGNASAHATARALSLPASGMGSLERHADGRVVVDIRTRDTTAGGVAELRNLGAQVENVSPRYSIVTAAVAPSALRSVASDPAVQYVMEDWAPHVGRVSAAQQQAVARAVTPQACAPTISEGDARMNVASARSTNHVDGSGETVGVFSDSFNQSTHAATHAAQDVVHGDLPGPGNPCGHPDPVDVVKDGSGSGQTDEGRAMTQLVHGLAPGADLAFSTVGESETQFATNINQLRAQAHPSVLVDDVFFPNEPFFQDGPIANAASSAVNAGVPYFTAAGNSNLIVGGHNVGSYEAPAYRPTACPAMPNVGEHLEDCHDFNAGAGVSSGDAMRVAPGGGFALDLQWAEPRGAVATDFDVFVVNGSGTVLGGSAMDSIKAQQPIEFFEWGNLASTAQNVRIVIGRFSGSATPRLKFVLLDSGGISSVQFNTSNNGDIVGPSVVGHASTSGIGAVAAIPYDNSNTPEFYSSRGPAAHYFQPVPSTAALGSPEVINTPNFAATDGVRTSFFAEPIGGVWRFYGTSAAAPQAAAIGALLLSKNPLLTPAEVLTAMHDTARPVATNGTPSAVGGGYLDANAALATVQAIAGKPTAVGGTPGDGQVTVHWSAPTSNGGIPITGYTITPTQNGVAQPPLPFSSPATSETITGLTNGDNYTFMVAATDADGNGPDSNPSGSVAVGAPTKPPAVAVTSNGDASVSLGWTAPAADNGDAVTGYVITPIRAGSAQAPQSVGVVNSAVVTGLTNGSSYTFQVAATNTRGTGEPSAPTAAVVVGVAGEVTGVVAIPDNGAATITFTPPVSNGTTITGYRIDAYRGTTHFSGANYSTATKEVVHGLLNGQPFKFVVRANTNGGQGPQSPFSAPITVGVPLAPGNPFATAGNGAVALHWSPSTNNGAAVTKYIVSAEVAGKAQTHTYRGHTTTATITGLKNGASFRFTIHAQNARGNSRSATSPTIVVGAPGAPTKVTAKPGHARATLLWTAPAVTNGAPVSGYKITPYRGGVALQPHVFHSAATTETVTGLGSGDTLTFTVAAINSRGAGVPSAKAKPILIS